MDGYGGEVLFAQDLVELDGVLHGLDEDDDLVEHERVEQIR